MAMTNPDITVIYKEQMRRMTKRVFPDIPDSAIENALNYSINKRYKPVNATIDNNYTKKSTNIYLRELTNYIMAKELSLTHTLHILLLIHFRLFLYSRNRHTHLELV